MDRPALCKRQDSPVLHLGEEKIDIKPGSLAYIPAGVFHALDNKSQTEDFVLLTLWEDAKHNELYNARIKTLGKSFKTVYEDQRRKEKK